MCETPQLPARADARLNRQRIIEAAHALFIEHGTAVEMRQVAERAGVGIGTIYRNFPAKADLVAAVATRIVESTEAALDAVFASDDPVEVVSAYISILLENFAHTAPLAMELMATSSFEEIKARVIGWMLEPRLEAAIERGIARGVFRPGLDPAVTRLFVASAADPLIALATAGTIPLERLRAGLVDLVLRALGAPSKGA